MRDLPNPSIYSLALGPGHFCFFLFFFFFFFSLFFFCRYAPEIYIYSTIENLWMLRVSISAK